MSSTSAFYLGGQTTVNVPFVFTPLPSGQSKYWFDKNGSAAAASSATTTLGFPNDTRNRADLHVRSALEQLRDGSCMPGEWGQIHPCTQRDGSTYRVGHPVVPTRFRTDEACEGTEVIAEPITKLIIDDNGLILVCTEADLLNGWVDSGMTEMEVA